MRTGIGKNRLSDIIGAGGCNQDIPNSADYIDSKFSVDFSEI